MVIFIVIDTSQRSNEMTREEYKKEIFNKYSSTKVYKSAKKYIKSLEKQLKAKDEEIERLKEALEVSAALEAMNQRTCEGCIRLYFDEIEKVYKCWNDVSDDVGYLHGEAVIRNIKDFCCNQFQLKEQ